MTFREKIDQKEALIGVIGLGYVGLPLVLRFCEMGFPVLGFDTDRPRWTASTGASPISSISPPAGWRRWWRHGEGPHFAATHDMAACGSRMS